MRWKFVIPVFTFILVAVLFTVFFMDSLVRRSMISTGESIFGAKVEIASVKTRFKDLSININGIKIADKNDYWKNIFEMDNIRFGLKPLPLLSKKVIIEEMTVDGIRWGTKRTTSGELSAAKREAIEKEKKRNAEGDESITSKLLTKIKEKGSSELNALPAVETLKNAGKEFKDISADKLIQAADLSSIKEMETMKTDLQGKFSQYESRLQN
jgi:uncharacterized protein (TIGR03545 family)